MEDGIQHLGHCMVDMKELSANPEGLSAAGMVLTPKVQQLEFSLACNDLEAPGRDRKPNALVQVAVIDPQKQHLVFHACTEIVEANKDPLFLTGVTFPSEYPESPETLVKLSVYDAKNKSQESSSFLGSATFTVRDLLRAKDERLTLSLRTSDGVCAAGTVVVSRLKMGEMEEENVDHIGTNTPSQKCPLVCDSAHHSCTDREDHPLTGPVFRNPVCKVYRFQTVDSKWMLVREQMEECTLSFSIPKQLLSLYVQEDKSRMQDLKDLGELSPHWDNLRKEVMTQYGGIISSYEETLAELDKVTAEFENLSQTEKCNFPQQLSIGKFRCN
ncbi:type II inositol 3,4-bisphosphate 4-phosphatase [Austrofundulus limnaeus]|uniref:phosphatidylinositol-3,4-bisphosphate 4-phosphatase n=1 Tax=Austrofundulus limnaeus TaxID=52670 RepID=A0A2I4B680_AUSLI|nr:PREDICTED: type II inositol 3,4-bisphosphate 4-phosphatase-like [Austrofundulus limnaeus]